MSLILRPVSARSPDEPHRAATQLELFFDLVTVIAVASITAAFHHAISDGHGLEKLANFCFLFVAIWWVWMNYTWYASAFDNDDALHRILTIVIMFGATLFAAGAEYIFETLDFRFGLLGWIVMRMGMIGLWLRVALGCPEYRSLAWRYVWGYVIAQGLWIALYFTVGDNPELVLTLGPLVFLVEFAVPAIAERGGRLPWHRHHIIERYGLLNIIVLGEVILSVALTLGHLYDGHFDGALLLAALSGTVIVFALWWLYFIETDHLASTDLRRAFLWGYGHILIFAAAALLGAGLGVRLDVLTHHAKVGPETAALYVNWSIAIYVFALWLIRDRFREIGWRRHVLLAGALVLILAAQAGLPPEADALIVIALLVLRMPRGSRAPTPEPEA